MSKQQINLKKYRIFCNDPDSTDFHVKVEDYFGTLATILNLLKNNRKLNQRDYQDILNNLREDLEYLQDNYKIVKK